MAAIERELRTSKETGQFCHGESPTLADCCLIPQVFNAKRFNVPMDDFPKVMSIYARCMSHSAFQVASPEVQVDAE